HVYIVRWYDNVDFREQATPVPVADDQQVTGIDFTIPTMRGTGSISGMVESEEGQPLSKVLVQAWLTERDGDWWGSVGHARTNELGEYVIDELPAGTYLVSADFFGDRIHVREWYDNARSADLATPVPVEDNQETVDINFSLDIDGNLGAIAGSVVSNSDGSPIPHAFVEAHGAQADLTGHFRGHGFAFTDEDGNYVIVDLPEGPYFVSLFADGIHEFYDDAQSVDEATSVEVFEGDTTYGINFGISVPDAIGGLISGLVFDDSTGLPVVSAVVVAVPDWVLSNVTPIRHFDRQFFRFTTTDELGNYAIRGLEDGGYYLFCFAEGYIGEFYDDVRDPTEASLVEIQGGQEKSGIDFGLTPWQSFGIGLSTGDGSLEGIAVDIDTLSIEGAYIYVLDADGNAVGFARSAPDGGYSVSGLQEGSYYLQASRIGFQTEFFGDAATLEGSIPITLGTNSGLSVESVDFTLESSTVTGVKRLQDAEIPTSLRLYQNFPNPFNPATEIQYDLPVDAYVSLIVYNLVGEEVVTLHYGPRAAGSYRVIWDGKNVSGRDVPSGIYFYRLQAGTHSLVRKAMLLR
ncbi:MAG: carboxypeptidase regulatory-like domain-containing protein, partial [Bacteroidota bacterium]